MRHVFVRVRGYAVQNGTSTTYRSPWQQVELDENNTWEANYCCFCAPKTITSYEVKLEGGSVTAGRRLTYSRDMSPGDTLLLRGDLAHIAPLHFSPKERQILTRELHDIINWLASD